VIAHVVARRSAVGYSGTNASGALVIRDSVWDENGAGILPNTYANEANPPQADIVIAHNVVSRSGRVEVPIHTPLAGFIGIGIAIAGGNDNVVRGNRVPGSERYGIAVFPTAHHVAFGAEGRQLRPYWHPKGNQVLANQVSGSGTADLALAAGVGSGNCFHANIAGTTLPAQLDGGGCPANPANTGDPSVASELTAPIEAMIGTVTANRHPPNFTQGDRPPNQPSGT